MSRSGSPPRELQIWAPSTYVQSIKWDDSLECDVITLWGLTHSGCTRLECLWASKVEEEEEPEEQEESSRAEEEEEMVRDMVLVFFCTLWTLHVTYERMLHISSESETSLFFIVFFCNSLANS